jgi:hypothetical protein
VRHVVNFAILIVLASAIVTWRYDLRAANPTFTSAATGLAQPSHRQSLPDALVSDAPVPYWDRDYLIVRVGDSARPDIPNVALYDSSGEKVREARIWFPDALHVVLASVAVTANGNIIASGEAYKVDGTLARCSEESDSPCFTFIAETDLSGKVEQVLKMGSFAAGSVCAASDGTVCRWRRSVSAMHRRRGGCLPRRGPAIHPARPTQPRRWPSRFVER